MFVKTKNSQDQMRIGRQSSSPKKPTRPPARSLPGTPAHHGKTLVGPPGKALAKSASRATARPMPAKSPPLFACSCRPNQLGRHLRGGMQIFVETHHCATSAAYLPTWHHGCRSPGRVSTREGAATDETGLSPVPDKARTPGQDALNAPCHVMRGITSHHCTLSTSCVPLWHPLSYKRRPEATRRRIRLFGAPHAPLLAQEH